MRPRGVVREAPVLDRAQCPAEVDRTVLVAPGDPGDLDPRDADTLPPAATDRRPSSRYSRLTRVQEVDPGRPSGRVGSVHQSGQ